jgi:hypothetical protein
MPAVAETKRWLADLFRKDKEPQPLFMLELILKQG